MFSNDVEPATIVAHGDVVVMCLHESFLKNIEKWQQSDNKSVRFDINFADLTEVGLLGKGAFGTVSMVLYFASLLFCFIILLPLNYVCCDCFFSSCIDDAPSCYLGACQRKRQARTWENFSIENV